MEESGDALLPVKPGGEPDVVAVAMREDQRPHVVHAHTESREFATQQLSVTGQPRVDDRHTAPVDDEVAVDRVRTDPVQTIGYLHMTSALDAAAGTGDPVRDVRAMAAAYRGFAHANPVAYTLMFAPPAVPGATARSVRSSATFLRVVEELAGPRHALELAGAFRLGGDIEQAWDFGLDRVLKVSAAGRRSSG